MCKPRRLACTSRTVYNLRQRFGETPQPLPAKPSQLCRYDYEYERVGTAVNLPNPEPLGSRRKVSVRTTKTSPDLVQEDKTLLDLEHPHPLYKALPPAGV